MQDPQVHPGELTTRDSPQAAAVERNVHGEFVGGRGELESLTFGWTAEPGDSAGKLTTGIGAGHPGGRTFHIRVRHTPFVAWWSEVRSMRAVYFAAGNPAVGSTTASPPGSAHACSLEALG